MKSEDKAMLIFLAGIGLMILLVVGMLVDSSNMSICLNAGMQWVDYDCVVIEGKTE